MNITELVPRLLVQTPDLEILKVSSIYERHVTAEVVYPVPGRTTVRTYLPEQIARWKPPSKGMVTKYEWAWGLRR